MNFVDTYVACPGKFWRIRPTKIEFESNFSSISQNLRTNEYSNFLLLKILRIRPSEIECEGDFSSLFNGYIPL